MAGRPIETLFLWTALLLYPAYALITPPFQTPDEHFHLFRAWQLSRFELIAEQRGDKVGGQVPQAYVQAAMAELDLSRDHIVPRHLPERPLSAMFAPGTPVPHDGPQAFSSNAALYSPAGYVPQVVAIWLAQAAGATVEWTIRLGRLLNAFCAVVLLWWALRVLPVGRLPMLLVALMPMSIASSAAFGQDGVVLGACCLLTAVSVRASLRARWQRADLAVVGAAGAVVTLSKMLYAPLTLAALLPPPPGRRLRWTAVVLMLVLPALALLGAWLMAVRGLVVPAKPELPTLAQQLAYVMSEPVRAAVAVVGGAVSWKRMGEMVGQFGWLNVGPSPAAMWLVGAATAVALLAGDPLASRFGPGRRAWWSLLAVGIVLALSALMYLVFTPLGAPRSEGVQGRYLLPLLPLFLLALLPARRWLPAAVPATWVVLAALVAANAASLVDIARAFYHP